MSVRTASIIQYGNAKTAVSEVGPLKPHSGAVMAAFVGLFPRDTRKTLARLLGLSDGGARKKLEGERTLQFDEFVAMLRTPTGFAYLTAVMSDSTVQWWRICAPLMEVADVHAMQMRARQKFNRAVKGAFDADASLTAARARADALLVQDPDFYSEHAHAVRTMSRVSNRPVASPAKSTRR